MQLDYIMSYDINSFLPYRKFFGNTISIFENEEIKEYLKKQIIRIFGRIDNQSYFPIVKFDNDVKKYVSYMGGSIKGYYKVCFAGVLWILDEKENVLISTEPELITNLEKNNEILKDKFQKLNEYNKPLDINQDYTPLFDFDIRDLTFVDKLYILQKLEIKTIIDCEYRNKRFLGFYTIEENTYEKVLRIIREEIPYGDSFIVSLFKMNDKEISEAMNLKPIIWNTFSRKNRHITLLADITKIPEEYLYDYAILKFDPRLDSNEIKRITTSALTNNMHKETFDISSMNIETEDNKYIHPALVAFCYMPNVFNMGLTRDKLLLASKVLYSTRNPKALEPILGEDLSKLFSEFAISTIPSEGYAIGLIKEGRGNLDFRTDEEICEDNIKEVIWLSRCSQDKEEKIRNVIIERYPSYLELFDTLRMIEMNRTITEQATTTKTLKKEL